MEFSLVFRSNFKEYELRKCIMSLCDYKTKTSGCPSSVKHNVRRHIRKCKFVEIAADLCDVRPVSPLLHATARTLAIDHYIYEYVKAKIKNNNNNYINHRNNKHEVIIIDSDDEKTISSSPLSSSSSSSSSFSLSSSPPVSGYPKTAGFIKQINTSPSESCVKRKSQIMQSNSFLSICSKHIKNNNNNDENNITNQSSVPQETVSSLIDKQDHEIDTLKKENEQLKVTVAELTLENKELKNYFSKL